MKIKYSEFQNNQINNILIHLNENKNENKNKNDNKNIQKLDDLYIVYEEVYNKNAKYYFANLFIEPVIFYNQELNSYIPIFNFSFLEYIFLDKSNHNEIEIILKNMKDNNYNIIVNPYFIKFFKKNKYILGYVLLKLNLNMNQNEANLIGGSIDDDLKVKLEKNLYYETYLISDFVHDFYNKNRSNLSINSINKINHYVKSYTESENKFFNRVFTNIIKDKKLNNNYILCSKNDIGVHFYQLLYDIYNTKNYYIIQDAGALSFFDMSEIDLNKIKGYFGSNIIKSVGVYMDPFTQIKNNSDLELIYKNDRDTIIWNYYNQICNTLFNQYFQNIGLKITDVYKNSYNINTQLFNLSFSPNYNSVSNISICLEYMLNDTNIFNKKINDIKNKCEPKINEFKNKIKQINNYLKLYKNQTNYQILLNILDQKKFYNDEIKKMENKIKEKEQLFVTTKFIFLSVMTYIFINDQTIFNTLDLHIKNIIIHFLLTVEYSDKDKIIKNELKKYKIRENILSYLTKDFFINTCELFNNEIYLNYLLTYFRNNITTMPILFQIILFFSRFKIMGDLLQLIEVDHSFNLYRNDKFKNKKGYLITQDRMLGTFSATYENANYICKNTLNGQIYLFFRK